MGGASEKESERQTVSRRQFVAGAATAFVSAVVGGIVGSQAFPKTVTETLTKEATKTLTSTATATVPTTLTSTTTATQTVTQTATRTVTETVALPKSGVIIHDPTVCRGCGICELACSLVHEGACGPSLSRIRIINDVLEFNWLGQICHQCDWPECYFACPVSAIKIDSKTGARYIDESVCIGCGKCAEACPFMPEVETLKKKTLKGKTVFIKCDLCKDREEGPACVEYCPRGALRYVPPSER